MRNVKPTKAESCFGYDQEENQTNLSFHYKETSLSFSLVRDTLYMFDWACDTDDIYKGQDLKELLSSYDIPLECFYSDFVGKGLTLSSFTDTFSIKLDCKYIGEL